jgi:predicted HTH transcriptional regulator
MAAYLSRRSAPPVISRSWRRATPQVNCPAMTPDELRDAIALGREQSSVEFKGPGLREKPFFAKVVRAVLGMSNHRDGGSVVLGVEEDKSAGKLVAVGMTPEQLASWTYDQTADGVAAYADPSVAFTREVVSLEGRPFLVLTVAEFSEVPVICKKGYATPETNVILREGACYVRPRRKPETVEVGTSADMRDLIELATAKRVRAFAALATAAGVNLGAATPGDDDLFDAQLKDLK